VVLLGSAPEPRVHNEFQGLADQLSARYGGMACLWLGYDEPLLHLIYAGSDVIVVPSLFEPCGLTQMVIMRYRAVPVVRKTGAFNVTVFDVDHNRERAQREGLQLNGYSFEWTDASAVDYAMNRALDHWYNARELWNNLARTVIDQDWS
jgi:starch synthase